MNKRPTVPGVRPAVAALYAKHSGGCCLHVVLDDGNIDDESVAWCVKYALENDHLDCVLLATTLLSMSKTQRGKLAR